LLKKQHPITSNFVEEKQMQEQIEFVREELKRREKELAVVIEAQQRKLEDKERKPRTTDRIVLTRV
jgi:hypothetical protein